MPSSEKIVFLSCRKSSSFESSSRLPIKPFVDWQSSLPSSLCSRNDKDSQTPRAEEIPTVFVETISSPRISQTLSNLYRLFLLLPQIWRFRARLIFFGGANSHIEHESIYRSLFSRVEHVQNLSGDAAAKMCLHNAAFMFDLEPDSTNALQYMSIRKPHQHVCEVAARANAEFLSIVRQFASKAAAAAVSQPVDILSITNASVAALLLPQCTEVSLEDAEKLRRKISSISSCEVLFPDASSIVDVAQALWRAQFLIVPSCAIHETVFSRPGSQVIELITNNHRNDELSSNIIEAIGLSVHRISVDGFSLEEHQHALVSGIAQIDVMPLKPPVAVSTPIPPVFDIPDPPPEILAERLKPRDPNNPRLAIIVPFRDSLSRHSQGTNRTKNLAEFSIYMNDFLKKRGRDFEIIVVEQSEGLLFNKGALLNAGYQISRQHFDYICLHDVDQVPTNLENDYRISTEPIHLCTGSSQYSFGQLYETMVGGALLLTNEQFEKMNGVSNKYWGWGLEDDDLYIRIKNAFGRVKHLPPSIGVYCALEHPRMPGLDITALFRQGQARLGKMLRHELSYQDDGFNNVQFRVTSVRRLPEGATIYNVDFSFKFQPKNVSDVDFSFDLV